MLLDHVVFLGSRPNLCFTFVPAKPILSYADDSTFLYEEMRKKNSAMTCTSLHRLVIGMKTNILTKNKLPNIAGYITVKLVFYNTLAINQPLNGLVVIRQAQSSL